MCNCVWGDSLWEPLILRIVNSGSLSSKHATLSHWWFNIGPASLTVDQLWTNNGSMPRVCWELKLCLNDAIQNFKWVKITLKNKGLHDLYDLFFVVFKIIVGIIAALWAYVWGGGGGGQQHRHEIDILTTMQIYCINDLLTTEFPELF